MEIWSLNFSIFWTLIFSVCPIKVELLSLFINLTTMKIIYIFLGGSFTLILILTRFSPPMDIVSQILQVVLGVY